VILSGILEMNIEECLGFIGSGLANISLHNYYISFEIDVNVSR
jgi:hypothetical protein